MKYAAENFENREPDLDKKGAPMVAYMAAQHARSRFLVAALSLIALLPRPCVSQSPQLSDSQFSAAVLSEPAISWSADEAGLLLKEGSQSIFFYQRKTKSLDGKFPRANYIHPLYDLDENVLTEDFPAGHEHQRGIFWAWHQLRVAGVAVSDPWTCKNIQWDVREMKVSPIDPQSVAIRLKVLWKCLFAEEEHWSPVVEERTTIRVFRQQASSRVIDFEIRLRALVDQVSIGGSEDEKGYGGYSAAIRLPDGLRMTGTRGNVTPQLTAVDAGPWVDFSARFGKSEQITGLAIFGHPSLPTYPPRWILRQKGSMQNLTFPGRVPVALSKNQPTILRYRMVIHREKGNRPMLDEAQQAYAQLPATELFP